MHNLKENSLCDVLPIVCVYVEIHVWRKCTVYTENNIKYFIDITRLR